MLLNSIIGLGQVDYPRYVRKVFHSFSPEYNVDIHFTQDSLRAVTVFRAGLSTGGHPHGIVMDSDLNTVYQWQIDFPELSDFSEYKQMASGGYVLAGGGPQIGGSSSNGFVCSLHNNGQFDWGLEFEGGGNFCSSFDLTPDSIVALFSFKENDSYGFGIMESDLVGNGRISGEWVDTVQFVPIDIVRDSQSDYVLSIRYENPFAELVLSKIESSQNVLDSSVFYKDSIGRVLPVQIKSLANGDLIVSGEVEDSLQNYKNSFIALINSDLSLEKVVELEGGSYGESLATYTDGDSTVIAFLNQESYQGNSHTILHLFDQSLNVVDQAVVGHAGDFVRAVEITDDNLYLHGYTAFHNQIGSQDELIVKLGRNLEGDCEVEIVTGLLPEINDITNRWNGFPLDLKDTTHLTVSSFTFPNTTYTYTDSTICTNWIPDPQTDDTLTACPLDTVQISALNDTVFLWTGEGGVDEDSIYRLGASFENQTVLVEGSLGGIDTTVVIREKSLACLQAIPIVVYELVSPNGDADNKTLFVQNIEWFDQSKMKVFSAWGEELFSSVGYKNDWNGEDLPDGNYYYQLDVPEQQKTYQGRLVIRR